MNNVLIPCSGVLLEKLTGPRAVKKFPAFYATRVVITEFASARHCPISRQINPVYNKLTNIRQHNKYLLEQ